MICRQPNETRQEYQNRFQREAYDEVVFYRVFVAGKFKTLNGETVELTPKDELFYSKGHRRWFNCPARNLTELLIPRVQIKRTHKFVKKP